MTHAARSSHAHRPRGSAAAAPGRVSVWAFDAADALEGRRVRHGFAAKLRAAGYGEKAIFAAELALGEMLGNVVRHARGMVQIRLDTAQAEAVVHVLDEGPGFAFAGRVAGDAWAEGGRGLGLIDVLVDDFSVRARSAAGGAHVRGVLRREPPAFRSDAIAAPKRTAL